MKLDKLTEYRKSPRKVERKKKAIQNNFNSTLSYLFYNKNHRLNV